MLGYTLNSYRAYLQKLTSLGWFTTLEQSEKVLSLLIPTTEWPEYSSTRYTVGLGEAGVWMLVYRVTYCCHCGEGNTAHCAPGEHF